MAASLDLKTDLEPGGPGKFAAKEIRRKAAAQDMKLSDDASATRISIAVEKDVRDWKPSALHATAEPPRQTTVCIVGEDFHINGQTRGTVVQGHF